MSSKIGSHRHLNPDQRDFIRSLATPAFLRGGSLDEKRVKVIARHFAKRFKAKIVVSTVRRVLLEYRKCCNNNGHSNGDSNSHKNGNSIPVFRQRRNLIRRIH